MNVSPRHSLIRVLIRKVGARIPNLQQTARKNSPLSFALPRGIADLTINDILDTIARTLEYPFFTQLPLAEKRYEIVKRLQEKPCLLISIISKP